MGDGKRAVLVVGREDIESRASRASRAGKKEKNKGETDMVV